MFPLGYLTIVLHAHLPFVRHPEYDDVLEEDWLFEAILETYLPLLHVFDDLERDQVDWRLTMSVSPTLAAMLTDELLQRRFVRHLDNLIVLASKELIRLRKEPKLLHVAEMYLFRFTRARDLFVDALGMNLLRGFQKHFDAGRLELITCGATHGYLPLMNNNCEAMFAQIEIGCREFERHFGTRPRGIWLPECGYTPGIDELLSRSGLRYFFVDTHGILHADPTPRCAVYSPLRCPSGVFALGRDPESSRQVWSSIEGYPGDYFYRDFYRDIGFDLNWEYVGPHLHSLGVRHFTGIKYHRVTGPGDEKEPYDPEAARQRAAVHAEDFLTRRQSQAFWLAEYIGRPPIVVAPYDAELFGHWWFEGPEFLDFLIRKAHFDQSAIRLTTVPEYLQHHPDCPSGQMHLSSWGMNGYSEMWLNKTNDWVYPHLHIIAERMVELSRGFPDPSPLERRALNQAARELLLSQSSDWAFILRTDTTAQYATNRTVTHVTNFNLLYDGVRGGMIDEMTLMEMESRNNLFPGIDYAVYQ